MNVRARRWLRWIFITAFFIAAPVVILSTAGYRYNFARQRLERTGAMIVESRPTGASISLNGTYQKSETPARFGRMTSGTYSVRVEKDGYRAWTKTVGVSSDESVFLNHIALFPEEAPVPFVPLGAYGATAFSPDARYAVVVASASSGSEIVVIDTKSGETSLPYRSSADATAFRLEWSPTSRRLLVAQTGETPSFLLWNASKPDQVDDLSVRTATEWSRAFWAQDADTLYGIWGDTLHEIDLNAFTATPLGPAVAEPVVTDQTLYGIVSDGSARLVRRRLRDQEFETIAELPSTSFKPVASTDRHITYVSVSSKRLFTINASGDRPTAFEGLGRDGVWSSDAARLLYWNDLEVRLYSARSGTDEVINRLSGPITQAAWHHPEWNALYSAAGMLYAIETDGRFGRVNVSLATFTTLERFAVSPNGDTAFIFGTKDGISGLWKLRLR